MYFIKKRVIMENRLTSFEKIRIIGQRAEQISNGAPIQISYGNLNDAISIAEAEFKQRRIPFLVNRTYPDGSIKVFRLIDMEYN